MFQDRSLFAPIATLVITGSATLSPSGWILNVAFKWEEYRRQQLPRFSCVAEFVGWLRSKSHLLADMGFNPTPGRDFELEGAT